MVFVSWKNTVDARDRGAGNLLDHPPEAQLRCPRVGRSEENVRILQFLIATLVVTLVACNPDQGFTPDDNDANGDEPGQISGRICDPSGRTWLADAMAYTNIVVDGQLTGTRVAYSDRDG